MEHSNCIKLPMDDSFRKEIEDIVIKRVMKAEKEI